ncbi:MAG: tRNA pseudouridine(38-40) synthase TruA [Desulfohalobiaceae bacterium]|nr:tRNA pseudouridine(38-40) synthase TruA [Desulfohalobiaceae bacterium]
MPRLALWIAYDGACFAGWQVQPRERSVQGCLETALSRICNRRIRVHGAGRTDSGVHALGQVAHCDIPEDRICVPWRRALNSLMPDDACVTSAKWVEDSFHARHSAKAKIYSYTLWTAPEYVIPQRRPFVWPVGELDPEAMRRVAEVFPGRRDFAAMQNVGTVLAHSVRSVHSVRLDPGRRPEEIVVSVTADGFLKQMVRIMVGCLVRAGRHKLSPGEMEAILDSRDRSRASATAPARGLCLEQVLY